MLFLDLTVWISGTQKKIYKKRMNERVCKNIYTAYPLLNLLLLHIIALANDQKKLWVNAE